MSHTDGPRTATRHRVVLRLLDHQVVGPDGQLLGNVDDLEILVSDGRWSVTGLAVGPGALGRRLPGRLGRWMVAVWRRLQLDPDPEPPVVSMSHVTAVGSALEVDQAAAEQLAGSFGLELWLREYVISRLPGAKGGGDGRQSDATTPTVSEAPSSSRDPEPGDDRFWISRLIQARVQDENGNALGHINEVVSVEPAGGLPGQLRVTHLEYGNHEAGAELGYNEHSDQGPVLVGALVRWWQRDSRVAPIEDVTTLDLDAGCVTVRTPRDHVHPHEL